MADLTDINEILEYLTSVGFSYKCGDKCVILNSEYFIDWEILISEMPRCYKHICASQTGCQLLDDLLINCEICEKYTENNYDISVRYKLFGHGFKVIFHNKCVNKPENIEYLMAYMRENHPECIRPVDIKIALK
jgi:hypothetical protein